jgi:hypothetical protein
VKSSINSIAAAMSRSATSGDLKGKDGLTLRPRSHRFSQHPPVRKIDWFTHNLGKPDLEPGQIEEGQVTGTVEIAHQIDIGSLGSLSTRYRPEHCQPQKYLRF